MIQEEILLALHAHQDTEYLDLQKKLIPAARPDRFLGVRTPELRAMAKAFGRREDIRIFLDSLPHRTFDEDQLHAFIISGIRDFDTCLREVRAFLPYVDNWATCDQMSPVIFSKFPARLLPALPEWLASPHPFTVRFGIKMLMDHFLGGNFEPRFPALVAAVSSPEYYVRMMAAWYFATALAKQYEASVPFLEDHALDPWTHNKAIQKALESRRITPEQKAYLRSLKVPSSRAAACPES